MAQTQKILSLGGRTITLIGTAHVSPESIAEVRDTITEKSPDCVCIELDGKRREALENPDSYTQMDIVRVLRKGEGFFLLANLVLSSFQRRLGQNVGVRPGEEMLCALRTAQKMGLRTEMVDRSIQVTLRRAWAKNSLWGKLKLVSALLASAFDREEVSDEQIENLKNSSEMDLMLSELSEYLPAVKEVLIDERDQFLASKIWQAEGSNICAVLGAGHLPGVQAHLEKIASGEEGTDTDSLDLVPAKKGLGRHLGWAVPLFIVALIAAGFAAGGADTGREMVLSWLLWNGVLAAAGAALAGGHVVTILAALASAPFTSLTPVVGVGVVAGLVQAALQKPKVLDMEKLQDDAASLKGWYRNRILRVLLVFLLSSIGSSIGTLAGGANLIAIFTTIAEKIRGSVLGS